MPDPNWGVGGGGGGPGPPGFSPGSAPERCKHYKCCNIIAQQTLCDKRDVNIGKMEKLAEINQWKERIKQTYDISSQWKSRSHCNVRTAVFLHRLSKKSSCHFQSSNNNNVSKKFVIFSSPQLEEEDIQVKRTQFNRLCQIVSLKFVHMYI